MIAQGKRGREAAKRHPGREVRRKKWSPLCASADLWSRLAHTGYGREGADATHPRHSAWAMMWLPFRQPGRRADANIDLHGSLTRGGFGTMRPDVGMER